MKSVFPLVNIVGFSLWLIEAARTNVNEFYRRIDQIVTKTIALTPDILNKDVCKSGSTIIAAIQLVKLIVAIVAIVLAIMALVH